MASFFFDLIAVLFIFVLIFGKRKVKKWEFEAELTGRVYLAQDETVTSLSSANAG
jgi:hypothetical protein